MYRTRFREDLKEILPVTALGELYKRHWSPLDRTAALFIPRKGISLAYKKRIDEVRRSFEEKGRRDNNTFVQRYPPTMSVRLLHSLVQHFVSSCFYSFCHENLLVLVTLFPLTSLSKVVNKRLIKFLTFYPKQQTPKTIN